MNENSKKNIWEEIDYSRPTIIEASAGTGKTYTLEHIVLELIINHDISINEILIVTFTEKAAGEIKERIRKIIASEFDRLITEKSNNQNAINKLKIALDIFDSADISTIHGFCKKILSQYAFENNSALSQEISKDTYTIEAFNNVILSEEFKNMGGVDILNGFFNNTPIEEIGKKFKFFEKHNENALNNTILGDYEEEGINPDDFKKNIRDLKEQTAKILNLGNFDPNIKYEINIFSPIAEKYWFTTTSPKGPQTVCKEKLKKLDNALSNILNHRIPLKNHSFFTQDISGKKFYISGNENTKYKLTDINIYQNLGKIYDNLFTEVRPLCKQIDDSFEKYRKHFEKCLVDLVLKERKRLKEEHQTISFDDLIINLDNALQPNASNSVALINALRGKYKIALIDEFQDTDALQWDIFSRIFTNHYEKEYPKNSFSESQNSLIVVGDPKQAIYKFRGADLNTYLLAKNIIKNDLNGQTKQLTTTYRCTNEMVEAFNTFFDNEWFNGEKEPEGAQNQKLEYSKVDYPENNLKTTKWFPEGFSTVNIVDTKLFKDFNCYIENCATIIKKLHGIKITDLKNENGKEIVGATKYSDFCFLVKTNSDAIKIANVLKRHKLPYILKKDSSLYESDEATAIIIVLKFLLEPNNRKLRHAALLTDFFDVHPRDIKNLENISSLDLPCFQRWLGYLNASRWEKLFHSMLYDSGLYYRLSEKTKTDVTVEIKLGTYNQLFEELLVATKEKQLSVYEFPSFLKGIRNKSDDDEVDSNSLKKVTDDPRIQIMTMHSSKGLEFKFVFYCAGFKETLSTQLKNCHYSRYDEKSKTVKTLYFNLDNAPKKIKDIIKYDDRSEVRRLTYVAITRAEYMIFFPRGQEQESRLPLNYKVGHSRSDDNPLCEFISGRLQELENTNNGIITLISPKAEESNVLDIDNTNNNDAELKTNNDTSVSPIYDLPNLMRNKISLDSFSSINQHHKEAHKGISFDDENEKEDDETIGDFTVEKSEIQKATTLLPPGATFGKCFHEIMEQLAKGTGGVDFKTVAALPERYIFTDKRLEEIVAPAMQKYGIVNQYIFGENDKIIDSASNELKRMVWNTLNTPIQMLGGKTLGSIQTADMKAELEFYINKNDYLTEEQKNNIMIGFIDLLFRVDGKYYILDWKTNMLQGYDSATVLEAMEEANYTLQHEIYSVATTQWLEKLFGSEAASLLGGSIYLFVRGGASNLGDKAGCYEKVWSPSDFASVCERIKGEINQAISFEQQNSY